MKGKDLCKMWNVKAEHSLYRESGNWYHQLKRFPGALFDKDGYIVFKDESEYRGSPYLQIKKDVHVLNGIANIPGYTYFNKSDISKEDENLQATEFKVFKEGGTKVVTLNKYERNNNARRACIDYYGAVCVVCKVNLEHVYGLIARGIIHIHHLLPISLAGENYMVDPVNDLRPVCPNCHSVIHTKNPPYSIEEVREMVRNNSNS